MGLFKRGRQEHDEVELVDVHDRLAGYDVAPARPDTTTVIGDVTAAAVDGVVEVDGWSDTRRLTA